MPKVRYEKGGLAFSTPKSSKNIKKQLTPRLLGGPLNPGSGFLTVYFIFNAPTPSTQGGTERPEYLEPHKRILSHTNHTNTQSDIGGIPIWVNTPHIQYPTNPPREFTAFFKTAGPPAALGQRDECGVQSRLWGRHVVLPI